ALGDEVGLAGLEDELGDLQHRAVDGHVFELPIDDPPEQHPEDADAEPAEQQLAAGEAAPEGDRPEVGQDEVRFAGAGGGGSREGQERGRGPEQPAAEGSTVALNAWGYGHDSSRSNGKTDSRQ